MTSRILRRTALPVLLMISGPLTLPPLGVMKMSPLLLFAPCFSTVTAGALAGAAAPDETVLQAVPVKTMTVAAEAAIACGARCAWRVKIS